MTFGTAVAGINANRAITSNAASTGNRVFFGNHRHLPLRAGRIVLSDGRGNRIEATPAQQGRVNDRLRSPAQDQK